MKTFQDLTFEPHKVDHLGKHAVMFFPNGYGVSVCRFQYSYGNENDLWEAAVIYGNESEYKLTYATPVTDDVIGHLTEEGVTLFMEEVQRLPQCTEVLK